MSAKISHSQPISGLAVTPISENGLCKQICGTTTKWGMSRYEALWRAKYISWHFNICLFSTFLLLSLLIIPKQLFEPSCRYTPLNLVISVRSSIIDSCVNFPRISPPPRCPRRQEHSPRLRRSTRSMAFFPTLTAQLWTQLMVGYVYPCLFRINLKVGRMLISKF